VQDTIRRVTLHRWKHAAARILGSAQGNRIEDRCGQLPELVFRESSNALQRYCEMEEIDVSKFYNLRGIGS